MKLKKLLIIFLIFCLLFTLVGCGNNSDENIQDKNKQQLDYIDSKVVEMMNQVNNITIENFKVSTKQVDLTPAKISEQSSSQQSGESSSGESGGGSGQQESKGQESQSGGGSQSEKGQNQGQQPKKVSVSEMINSSILNDDKKTDWEKMKVDVESLYETWNSIILDLYKLNIKNEDIISFSSTLDSLALAIKAEDKAKTTQELANLYSYIPKYLEYYSTDSAFNNIKNTKLHLMYAYSSLETDNWDNVNNEVTKAEENFLAVVNNLDYAKNKQYSVNRAYISLMELKNSLGTKDKDIFYINYKSFMENVSFL